MPRPSRAGGPILETYYTYLSRDGKWYEEPGYDSINLPDWAQGTAVRAHQRRAGFDLASSVVQATMQPAAAVPAPLPAPRNTSPKLPWTPEMKYVLHNTMEADPYIKNDHVRLIFATIFRQEIQAAGLEPVPEYKLLYSQASERFARKGKDGRRGRPVPEHWRVIMAPPVTQEEAEWRSGLDGKIQDAKDRYQIL